MLNELKKQFLEVFGGTDEGLRVFSSPGRVNLIGEHTDYNGGYVFPAALTMATTIIARPRTDSIVRMKATDLDGVVEGDLNTIGEYKDLKWGNYQFGIFDELKKAGYNICGADMLFHDTTPHGGGLSSSAAIEVSAAIAMASLGGAKDIDNIEMAKISQAAEHNYIGVNCGIMDQFASAMGKANHVIFLDCKTLDYQLVPMNLGGCKLVISNTNKKRSLADSKYNERRAECEAGLEMLKAALPDKNCLGEISMEEYEANKHLITDETVNNRVCHVISEDDRVLRSVEVLKQGDLNAFGKLMNASHESLRDLYEVSCTELDTLVESAQKLDCVLGSRMTGAGFGGCTVSLVKEDGVDEFIEKVGAEYLEKVGYAASFYISEIGDGGREIVNPF
ncbi:MAG: galactokinase [Monoglobaceae bacterium]